jgi:hypothetical protein
MPAPTIPPMPIETAAAKLTSFAAEVVVGETFDI